MAEPTFRGRIPRPLAFGTSGLRGLVTDLTDLEVWVNTRGFVEFLRTHAGVEAGAPIRIGGDLRPSTERILRAVTRALSDAGHPAIHHGRLPTPALTLAGLAAGEASVMVTGSHIPFDRNGIKFNRPTGEVSKADEGPILAAVARFRGEAYAASPARSPFDDGGTLRPGEAPELPPVDVSAAQAYLRRWIDFFGPEALRGARLAVYQHSAVGRDLLVEVLRGLGASVHPVGRSETFVAVDTEAVDQAMVDRVAALVPEARAALGGLDAVLSTDGDSDRPLLLAVDDGRLAFIRGDTLGAMVAEDLDADAIAVPVSVSDRVDRHLAHRGTAITRTRIGSPWVIEAMADMEGAVKLGFEANGGVLLETRVEREGRTLSPLPTRDAFLPMLTVLCSGVERGQPLPERLARLPPRFTTAGLVDEVPPAVGRAVVDGFGLPGGVLEAWTGVSSRLREEGREARSPTPEEQAALERVAERLERHFGPYGLTGVEHVSWVDGLRVRFSGGEVVHLRPSGNAPQFRVYVTADTMARAEAVVATCLGPTGPVSLLVEAARAPGKLLA